MKQAFYKNRWLWFAFAALVLTACLLQTLAILTAYKSSSNYFDPASPLPLLSFLCTLLASVIGTVAACRIAPTLPSATPFWKSSLPAPILLGFLAAALAIFFSENTMTNKVVRPLTVAMLVLASIYAALVQISFCRRHRAFSVLPGFCAVLACILINAYYYFDVSVEMNAPLKTSTQTAILFLILYLTAELRYLFDDPRQRLYLSLAAWTVAFGVFVAVPLPIAYLAGKTDRIDYVAGGILMLSAVVTVILRVLTLLGASQREQEAAEGDSASSSDETATDVAAEASDLPESADDQNESDRKDQP